MASNRGVSATLISILVAIAVKGGIQAYRDRKPDVRSKEFLSGVAETVNKGLPKLVDSETELMNVVGLDGVIVYNYRLVNLSASEVEAAKIETLLKPSVVNQACSTPETRRDFLNQNIAMRYAYHDKSRVRLAAFEVRREDCRQ